MEISYFGYGSNMDYAALAAKGVTPRRSCAAQLVGWRLRFNVEHFFRHEGGVGNIEKTGKPENVVHGVLHVCDSDDLVALDKLEGRGIGYDRIEVDVVTGEGVKSAYTYVGLPAYVNDACRPTRRYLNILLRGAKEAKLDRDYIAMLEDQQTFTPPQRQPFQAPKDGLSFDYRTLEKYQTVLAGNVFCMKNVRFAHELARDWFGGKDVTQFHLRRMDNSTGSEKLRSFIEGDLRLDQYEFLNSYLHAFSEEYRHIGTFNYTNLPPEMVLT